MGASKRRGDLPVVVVCAGKDCRRHAEFGPLCARLDDVATVRRVGCLGLCDSPVAVVRATSPRPIVLEKIRTTKQRRDLVAVLVDDAPLSSRLKARRLTGGRQERTVRRLRRRLAA